MKHIHKYSCVLLSLLFSVILLCCGCGDDTEQSTKINVLDFNKQVEIKVDETTKPKYFTVVSEKDLTKDDILFISEDESVATVQYHSSIEDTNIYYTIKGISEGETYVYFKVKADGTESDKIKISVKGRTADVVQNEPQQEDSGNSSVDVSSDDTQSIPSQGDTSGDTSSSGNPTYILNKSSKKFHYPTCSSAKKIIAKNYGEHFGTRQQAIDMGYKPCGICKP